MDFLNGSGLGFSANLGGGEGFDASSLYFTPEAISGDLGSNFGGGNSFLGNMSPFQAGVAGLGALSSAFGAFNGYKQTKLAKQQLAFQKDAFNKQWGAQRNLTNSHLEDRQKQRVARNPNAMSVAEYMNKYGI